MMSVRFTVTLVILLSFEALKPEAFPAGPLAAALKRKSFDLAPLPVPSALHDVSKTVINCVVLTILKCLCYFYL